MLRFMIDYITGKCLVIKNPFDPPKAEIKRNDCYKLKNIQVGPQPSGKTFHFLFRQTYLQVINSLERYCESLIYGRSKRKTGKLGKIELTSRDYTQPS